MRLPFAYAVTSSTLVFQEEVSPSKVRSIALQCSWSGKYEYVLSCVCIVFPTSCPLASPWNCGIFPVHLVPPYQFLLLIVAQDLALHSLPFSIFYNLNTHPEKYYIYTNLSQHKKLVAFFSLALVYD